MVGKKKHKTVLGKSGRANAKGAKKDVKKETQYIKDIVRSSMIGGVVLAVLGAAMHYSAALRDDTLQEKKTMQSELRGVRSKTDSLNGQISSLSAAQQTFAELSKGRSNTEFEGGPLTVRPLLAQLKEKYRINALNVEFNSRQQLEIKNLPKGSAQPSRFTASMRIASVSDHFIYQFLQDFKNQMPGFIHFTKVDMNRQSGMSLEMLGRISRGQQVEVAAGNIEFVWYSFVDNSVPDDEVSG